MQVSVSIFSKKTSKERIDVINKLNSSNADFIHFDVADGKFVESKYLCIPELVKLLKLSKKKNDVHLMVEDPIKYIEQIKNLNVDTITIHVEINKALMSLIETIKKSNIKVGLAVDLDTSIDSIKPYLKLIDRVLPPPCDQTLELSSDRCPVLPIPCLEQSHSQEMEIKGGGHGVWVGEEMQE